MTLWDSREMNYNSKLRNMSRFCYTHVNTCLRQTWSHGSLTIKHYRVPVGNHHRGYQSPCIRYTLKKELLLHEQVNQWLGVLGNWYVSNVSIIFDCSMLLYYPFWMFMSFILHIYIIFGTNLLTGGPAHIVVFCCLFQYFEEKEYQTESKQNENFGGMIFGTNEIQRTWSASQEAAKAARSQEGAPPSLGPHRRPPTYFFLLYIPTYP